MTLFKFGTLERKVMWIRSATKLLRSCQMLPSWLHFTKVSQLSTPLQVTNAWLTACNQHKAFGTNEQQPQDAVPQADPK